LSAADNSDVVVMRGADTPANPRVSVVIAAYDSLWLDDALDSVRRQTLAGSEILVIDDGSRQPVVPQRKDDLILVRQPNAGPGGARNRGFALARGEFIALLDSDDRWLPGKLEAQVAFLDRHPACVLSSANWSYVTAEGSRTAIRFDHTTRPGSTIALERLFFENCICCSAVMLRREALRRTPGMAPHRRFGEDYGLWLRLAMLGSIGYLDDVLVEKRLHPNSLVHQTARDGSWFEEELAVYNEFLTHHERLRSQRFVQRAFGRLYFERAYRQRLAREWVSGFSSGLQSLRYDPFRTKAWFELLRALCRV
jgi:glycosyltransferase involved in cell wall biosynthesis